MAWKRLYLASKDALRILAQMMKPQFMPKQNMILTRTAINPIEHNSIQIACETQVPGWYLWTGIYQSNCVWASSMRQWQLKGKQVTTEHKIYRKRLCCLKEYWPWGPIATHCSPTSRPLLNLKIKCNVAHGYNLISYRHCTSNFWHWHSDFELHWHGQAVFHWKDNLTKKDAHLHAS